MRRRKAAVFFLVSGICLVAIAVVLNVSWVLLSFREVALLIVGVIFFAMIITGLTLNTIFLVREVRRNEQHDAFLNAVTHELKTPIASIRLYLETLKSRKIDEAKRAEFYDVMLADSDRLIATVEQVLQASRTREKGRGLHRAEIDIRDLLDEIVATTLTRYHLEESSIRLSVPTEPVVISADREELRSAFSNLLDNAIKYSPDGPRLSIRVAVRLRWVDTFVKDSGIGVSRADLKRIFKRFYRSREKAASAAKGTGLGLAIVRAIVERHGGKVSANSAGLGKGSTFIVRLPR
ncbi:MAG: sensor histidine kinase [Pyrinomonadaceae bacterium]